MGEQVKTILVKLYSDPIENITLDGDKITSVKGPNHSVQILYQNNPIGVWDGTNDAGNPATNGMYHITVSSMGSTGVVKTVTQQVMVSRALQKVTLLVYNGAGEIVRHLYTDIDDPGPSGATGMQLSTSVIQPSLNPAGGTPSQLDVVLSSGATLTWDGRSDAGNFVRTGQYFVEMHSTGDKDGGTTVNGKVTVLTGGDVPLVTAQPNLLNAAQGVTAADFTTDPAAKLTLNVFLYTMAGELTRVVWGTPGSGTAHLDASGLASGLYLAVVELSDARGSVGRQTKRIAVIH